MMERVVRKPEVEARIDSVWAAAVGSA
jgi:hypothetical protein